MYGMRGRADESQLNSGCGHSSARAQRQHSLLSICPSDSRFSWMAFTGAVLEAGLPHAASAAATQPGYMCKHLY